MKIFLKVVSYLLIALCALIFTQALAFEGESFAYYLGYMIGLGTMAAYPVLVLVYISKTEVK